MGELYIGQSRKEAAPRNCWQGSDRRCAEPLLVTPPDCVDEAAQAGTRRLRLQAQHDAHPQRHKGGIVVDGAAQARLLGPRCLLGCSCSAPRGGGQSQ